MAATVYRCPNCDNRITVHVRLSAPPTCSNNRHPQRRVHVMVEAPTAKKEKP